MEILLQKPKSGAEALQELDEEAAKHAMRFHRSIWQCKGGIRSGI